MTLERDLLRELMKKDVPSSRNMLPVTEVITERSIGVTDTYPYFTEVKTLARERAGDLRWTDNAIAIPAYNCDGERALVFPLTNHDAVSMRTFSSGLQAASQISHPALLRPIGLTSFCVDSITEPAHLVTAPHPDMVNVYQHLMERGNLDLSVYLQFIQKLAETVDSIHDQGYVHLHLLPSTIWMHPKTGDVAIGGYQYARRIGEPIDDIPVNPNDTRAPLEFREQSLRNLITALFGHDVYHIIDTNMVARVVAEVLLNYRLRNTGEKANIMMEEVTTLTLKAGHANIEKRFRKCRDYVNEVLLVCNSLLS